MPLVSAGLPAGAAADPRDKLIIVSSQWEGLQQPAHGRRYPVGTPRCPHTIMLAAVEQQKYP